jgi:predicted Zn-dependent protease
MKLFKSVLAIAAICLFASTALAKDWNHPAGFALWLPDGWKTETDEDVLSASDADEEVAMGFFVAADADTVEEALKALDGELSKFIKDIEAGEPEETKINGLDAVTIDGKGKVEGVEVDLGVAVIAKNDKVLIVFGAVPSPLFKKHEATIGKIFTSIK